jgi:hypothetical protein
LALDFGVDLGPNVASAPGTLRRYVEKPTDAATHTSTHRAGGKPAKVARVDVGGT